MNAIAEQLQPFKTAVNLNAVSLRRGNRLLIENLSLTLNSGELLYVTGENGIGKTSLLFALAGFLQPDKGSIKCNNPALMHHPDGASKGLTTEEDMKFHLNLYGLKNAKHATIEILKTVGLTEAQTVKTEDLSLGQRKRLSLAKTITSQRSIWLLDEPFSALDTTGQNFVETTISTHLSIGGICIIATHLPRELKGHKSKTLHLSTVLL